jgi:hypothetical protein
MAMPMPPVVVMVAVMMPMVTAAMTAYGLAR